MSEWRCRNHDIGCQSIGITDFWGEPCVHCEKRGIRPRGPLPVVQHDDVNYTLLQRFARWLCRTAGADTGGGE